MLDKPTTKETDECDYPFGSGADSDPSCFCRERDIDRGRSGNERPLRHLLPLSATRPKGKRPSPASSRAARNFAPAGKGIQMRHDMVQLASQLVEGRVHI